MKILGPEIGYVDLLDHVTTETQKKDAAEGRGFNKTPIRPSAAGQCSRELAYSLAHFHGLASYPTEVREPAVVRLLALGHSIEYHAIKQFEQLKDFFEIKYKQQVLSFAYLEAKKNKKLSQWLEGSLDVVFWSDKHKGVIDFKSKKDRFSASYRSNWDESSAKLKAMKSVGIISENAFWVENLEDFLTELNDPFFAANFLQLNLYANSSFLKERDVNHGSIIQYAKNDSRLREVRFKPCAKLYKQVLDKFQAVIDAVDNGSPELAPRDYVLGSVKCAFCPYKTECWGDKDAKKAFFNTFSKKQWPTDLAKLRSVSADDFKRFQELEEAGEEKKRVQTDITKALIEAGTDKVRLDNGDVYEVRQTQKEIYLKRSKA